MADQSSQELFDQFVTEGTAGAGLPARREDPKEDAPEPVNDPAPEPAPAPAPKPEPEPLAAKDDKPDSDDSFNPKLLMQAISRLSDDVRNLNGRYGELSGKYGGLDKQMGQVRADFERALTQAASSAARQGEDSPTRAQIDHASQSSKKWLALKDEYPEWAEALEERFGTAPMPTAKAPAPQAAPAAEMPPKVDPRVDELTAENARTQARLGKMLVLQRHPDLEQIDNSDEFRLYLGALPPGIKEQAGSNDPEVISYLIDQYKLSDYFKQSEAGRSVTQKTSQQIAAERDARLKQSASPVRGQPQGRRGAVDIDDMTPEQQFAHFARELSGGQTAQR